MDKNNDEIFKKLPNHIWEKLCVLPKNVIRNFEEIRLRVDNDTVVIYEGEELSLNDRQYMHPDVLDETLNKLVDYSYYAYEEELSKGYITINGGHRVGVCGRVTLRNGEVDHIKDITSLNIRKSKEIIGASDKVIDNIVDFSTKQLLNTLIISPPKCGKTTLIRDIARSLSYSGFKVAICDERSEIAGCCGGRYSYDMGPRTDVLDGCPKALGMIMLIRSMSPDVIITDEIGKPEDASAIDEALCAGVKIITTIHGNSYEEILRSSVGDLIKEMIFDNLIFLSSKPSTGTVSRIMKLKG